MCYSTKTQTFSRTKHSLTQIKKFHTSCSSGKLWRLFGSLLHIHGSQNNYNLGILRQNSVHKWMAELKYGWLATPYPRNKTLDTEGSDECSCGPWFLRWQGEPWGATHSSFLGIA